MCVWHIYIIYISLVLFGTDFKLIIATYFPGLSRSLKNQVVPTKPSEIKRDKSWKLRTGKGRMRHYARARARPDNALPIDKSLCELVSLSKPDVHVISYSDIRSVYPSSSKFLRYILARATSPLTVSPFPLAFLSRYLSFVHIQLYPAQRL